MENKKKNVKKRENNNRLITKINHSSKAEFSTTKKSITCGIDEAGRGSLSGPLVVAGAIIPPKISIALLQKTIKLTDSKIMSKLQRQKAYEWIKKNCFFSYVIIDPKTIDSKNIFVATQEGMKKVFLQMLEIIPFQKNNITRLVTDAVPIKIPKNCTHGNLEIINPTHAESKYLSVAAASVIAKEVRDNLMIKLAHIFPNFHTKDHKGYGTKKHFCAIQKNGISIIHRKTFVSKIIKPFSKSDAQQQQTII